MNPRTRRSDVRRWPGSRTVGGAPPAGPRRWVATAFAAALVVGLAGCAGAQAGSAPTTGASAPTAPGHDVGTTVDVPLTSALQHLELRDATGTRRTLGDFRGKVLVLAPGMTLCQESCPIDTAGLVETARRVDRAGLRDRVAFVTVTVDPQRDTPAQLAAYRRLFKPAPSNWLTLTGSPEDVRQLWHTIGVYVKKVHTDEQPPPRNWRTGRPLTYDVDHSDEVFFFDTHQHDRFVLEGMPHINHSAAVPKTLLTFMGKEGRENVADPKGPVWTVDQAVQVVSWLTGERIPS